MKHPSHPIDRAFALAHAAAVSRRGTHRDENQDSVVVDDHVWIVADGMGGHEGGRTASAVAAATAALNIAPDEESLADAVELCHDHVIAVGEVTDQPSMGSTIVVAARDPESGSVRIAWCGDSRAYLLSEGSLTRLTRDHNLAEEELSAGRITDAQAFDHPGQTILTSALGCGNNHVPEIGQVEISGTGRLLLCTDGLTSGLRDERIATLLDGDDIEAVAAKLVDAAVAAGSSDDTTVVVVDLEWEVQSDEQGADEEQVDEEQVDEHIENAVQGLGAQSAKHERGVLHFHLGELAGYAYDKGGRLLRASILLDDELSLDEALDWVGAQPRSRVGNLEVSYGDADRPYGQPRLVVERLLPLDEKDARAIADEVRAYSQAWDERGTLTPADCPAPRHTRPDVLTQPPRNAWLLYGSRASLDAAAEHSRRGEGWDGISGEQWTVPKHVEPGDLVFLYFRSPLKEIRYAARVASHPFYDEDTVANVEGPLARQQWWAWLTPFAEVGPVPLAKLTDLAGERVVARAHGGTYLRPELADALVGHVTASDGADGYLRDVCRPVQERVGLPDPSTMTLEEWCSLPIGHLRLEADVERFIVAPLLRWLTEEIPGASVVRQKSLGGGFADYAVEADGEVILVVEAKQRVPQVDDAKWADVPAVQQLRRYMVAARCEGLLVGAHEVHLFGRLSNRPRISFPRAAATGNDLSALTRRVIRATRRRTTSPQMPASASGQENMLSTLAGSGLVCPPLGPTDPTDLVADGDWHWSSRHVPRLDLYLHRVQVVAGMLEKGHFFALSHGGHGINSYGLSLVTGKGSVAAFVQHGYGGGYMDSVERRVQINQTYERLHALLEGIEEEGDPRWLLAFSDFRGSMDLIDIELLRTVGEERATVRYASEETLFEAVAAKVMAS